MKKRIERHLPKTLSTTVATTSFREKLMKKRIERD